jgi:hypothetical protein
VTSAVSALGRRSEVVVWRSWADYPLRRLCRSSPTTFRRWCAMPRGSPRVSAPSSLSVVFRSTSGWMWRCAIHLTSRRPRNTLEPSSGVQLPCRPCPHAWCTTAPAASAAPTSSRPRSTPGTGRPRGCRGQHNSDGVSFPPPAASGAGGTMTGPLLQLR